MGLPLCTCEVVNRPAAVRAVRVWRSEPAGTVKPSAVRVRDCLSSSHSSLMADGEGDAIDRPGKPSADVDRNRLGGEVSGKEHAPLSDETTKDAPSPDRHKQPRRRRDWPMSQRPACRRNVKAC